MDTLGGITDLAKASDTSSRTSNRNELSREEFFKIMTAQLQGQDPSSPMESENFLNQLVSLQSLDTQQALSDSLGGLVEQQEFSTASNIIGKLVVAVKGSQAVEGLADRVVQNDGKVEVAIASDLSRLSPSGAIGKDVLAYDIEGNLRDGTAERVSYQNGIPYLILTDGFGGEASVPFDQVVKVTSFVSFNDIKEIATNLGLPEEL